MSFDRSTYECPCGAHLDATGQPSNKEVKGQLYHASCFKCSVCTTPLSAYVEKDSTFYCTDCASEKFSKTCFACRKKLDGQYVAALGFDFHSECFICLGCGSALGSAFVGVDGLPFCDQACVEKKKLWDMRDELRDKEAVAPLVAVASEEPEVTHITCFGCAKPILDKVITDNGGRRWHDPCMICGGCNKVVPSNYSQTASGELFCDAACYAQSQQANAV